MNEEEDISFEIGDNESPPLTMMIQDNTFPMRLDVESQHKVKSRSNVTFITKPS
jgi:hypothetical protein